VNALLLGAEGSLRGGGRCFERGCFFLSFTFKKACAHLTPFEGVIYACTVSPPMIECEGMYVQEIYINNCKQVH